MSRRTRFSLWTGAAASALGIVYAFPPAQNTFYPRCPFYACTHLLCPGCGGTRALHELLHWNLRGALHFNALLTVLSPFVLIWFAWNAYQLLRYDRLPPAPWPRTVALILGVASVAFTVARNAGLAFTI